jgi:hypothetical protein
MEALTYHVGMHGAAVLPREDPVGAGVVTLKERPFR